MPTNGHHDLDPIEPSTARDLYLDHKASHCVDRTVQSHRYRLKYFVQWCEENGIDNLNDLKGRHLHEYRLWRTDEGGLNDVSVRTQMTTIRVFVKWCGTIEAVTPELYTKVMVPRVGPEEAHREEMLEADRAQEILDWLCKYQYASRDHVLIALLWETGLRIGGAKSLDVTDVDLDDQFLQLEHRPNEGTTLKNGAKGERLVSITAELSELLASYITEIRQEVSDEYGREPLLTSRKGRLSRATIRRTVYELTAPCFLDEECPDCSDDRNAKCSEAVSPHAIRRGSITHYLTNDVPVEIVGDRMDVSRKILDKHYDQRSEEIKLEQRRSYLDDI